MVQGLGVDYDSISCSTTSPEKPVNPSVPSPSTPGQLCCFPSQDNWADRHITTHSDASIEKPRERLDIVVIKGSPGNWEGPPGALCHNMFPFPVCAIISYHWDQPSKAQLACGDLLCHGKHPFHHSCPLQEILSSQTEIDLFALIFNIFF